ncbi:hypothetical protein ETD83_21265 [Actinomadura soli]|uniref:Uncharacterized protein n=1 Tax=Actinomadura soli TaxID=2508997 RepID=A0A5C4J9Y9_9ACTN|nr:hypothetical protein [Actinomadura soli]TMQ96625.1 hypothetical protein ETD83_21265 [Actinomadura soli]
MMAAHERPREEPQPVHQVHEFRVPWLALASVAATIAAASAIVLGIGDTLDGDGPPGRLLPLQAASPPATPPAGRVGHAEAGPPESPETRMHDALVRLRLSVDQGVEAGDVRGDAGLDLTAAIERILDRLWSPPGHRRADVTFLHQRIAVRTREGAIAGHRADELHLILDRAS